MCTWSLLFWECLHWVLLKTRYQFNYFWKNIKNAREIIFTLSHGSRYILRLWAKKRKKVFYRFIFLINNNNIFAFLAIAIVFPSKRYGLDFISKQLYNGRLDTTISYIKERNRGRDRIVLWFRRSLSWETYDSNFDRWQLTFTLLNYWFSNL